MDRAEALAALPGDYGFALLLREAGADPATIADRLGIDERGVATLLELAERKLAVLLAS